MLTDKYLVSPQRLKKSITTEKLTIIYTDLSLTVLVLAKHNVISLKWIDNDRQELRNVIIVRRGLEGRH